MADIVKIEWTETSRYSTFVELPDGVTFEMFDKSKYDLEDGLADLNEDRNYEGCERSDIEVYNQRPASRYVEVDELDWESLEIEP